MAVIADLHGHVYGKNNERLLGAIKDSSPDVCVIPGDLILAHRKVLRKRREGFEKELSFVKELTGISPVVFSPGNHEANLKRIFPYGILSYFQLRESLLGMGILLLENESVVLDINDQKINFTGADIDMRFYRKLKGIKMPDGYLEKILPPPKKDLPNVLAAHNPLFFKNYSSWGADLVLSGHNHGGLIRLPFLGSVVSSQLTLFPKYDAGLFRENDTDMYVSRGLGTHTINIRINNRAELVIIDFLPK